PRRSPSEERMKRKAALVLCASVLILLFAVPRVLSGPRRTQVYFSAFRAVRGPTSNWLRSLLDSGNDLILPVLRRWDSFQPVWTQLEPGMNMELDPYDDVSLYILENGQWEPESVQGVTAHLSPGATFIDVGAHIGYYSLEAAPLVGANGHVLAIEP